MTTNVSPWCIFTIHHLRSSPILVMDFTPKKFIEDIVVQILDQVSLFHCDKCSKHFTKKESLKRHNKNVHNLDFLTQNHFFLATLLKDEKEYSCPKLKPIQVIKEFETNFLVLHEKFKLTITNKIHIMITHVPEYIMETKLSLGQTSDQLIEASHQYVNKRFNSSHYKINNVDSPMHGKKLLHGLHHINAYNFVTK